MEPQTVQTQVQAPSWFLLVRLFYVLSETEHLRGEVEGEQCPAPPLSPLKATRAKLLPAVTENIQGCHAYQLCKGPGARAKLSGGHCAGGGASALTLNLQPLEPCTYPYSSPPWGSGNSELKVRHRYVGVCTQSWSVQGLYRALW